MFGWLNLALFWLRVLGEFFPWPIIDSNLLQCIIGPKKKNATTLLLSLFVAYMTTGSAPYKTSLFLPHTIGFHLSLFLKHSNYLKICSYL